MRTIKLMTTTLFFLFGVLEINAQNNLENETIENEFENEKVYDVADKMPEFPGGTIDLFEYIKEKTEEEGVAGTGRVIVTFIVEPNGSITHAKVSLSRGIDLDEAALRIVESMPKWTPGEMSGKTVRVKYTLPITFR